jgi:hypothetical protein
MNRTMRAIGAIVAFLACAAAAQAQPAPWEPERLTAGWTFVPAVAVGGLWDSNSTLRATGDPQLRQWVGVVNPRGEFDYNGRRTRFLIGYSGALEAYNTLQELTRYDQRGRLFGQHRAASRLTFRGQSSLAASPTTERIELGGLPFENVGSVLYEARAGAEYALSRRTSFSADYEHQWIEFQRAERLPGVLNGGLSFGGIGTLRHALTSRFSAGGTYTYRQARTNGGIRDINVQDAIGVVAFRVAENTELEGGIGVAHLEIVDTRETRTGPSIRAAVRHGLSRTRLELNYQRSFVPSWTFAGTTTNEELRASIMVPFARGRGSVQGSGAYLHNQPLTSLGDRIVLDSWWTGASVGYALARWIRVEGFYSGSVQKSSAQGEIDRTRVGIQFVTLKPVRIQ